MLAQKLDLNIQKNEDCNRIRQAFTKYPIKQYGEDERLVVGTDVTLETREKLDLYLSDIENITGREMIDEQKKLVKEYVNNNRIYRVDSEEHDRKRKQFHRRKRALRREWEARTGQAWPRYQENVYENGKIYRMKGQYYDAHHIIEISFGGPNEWYNLFPAASPDEHQYGIHDDYSVGTEIFGPIDKRYRKKKRNFKNLVLRQDLEKKEQTKKEEKKPKKQEPESKVTKLSERVIRIWKERLKR